MQQAANNPHATAGPCVMCHRFALTRERAMCPDCFSAIPAQTWSRTPRMQAAAEKLDRFMRLERLRLTQADNEQARLIRLQLAQYRRKRIEAGIRALGICGRLRGDCRAVWTRRTLKALNRARALNNYGH